MSTENNVPVTEPKTRTPRNYDSIRNGALSLTLSERARLAAELKESVVKEAQEAKAAAEAASALASGL